MKNQQGFLNILMLLPLLLFSTVVSAQSDVDPQRDLSVRWQTNRNGGDPGIIMGDITNKSVNTYPCVWIELDLYTRFDMRPPGEESKHLGVLPIEVQNVTPRTVRNFKQPLPYPAGVGLKGISACPNQRPEPGTKILSFTAEPLTIQAGQTATLQWRIENAQTILVGEGNPQWSGGGSAEPILRPRSVEAAGSLQVSPSQTTTYRLKAVKGPLSTYKDVTIRVTSPPPVRPTPTPPPTAPPTTGFCSISGRIVRDKREYGTTVGLYATGNTRRRLFSAAVDSTGRYTFTDVPAREYQIIPRGNYPSGRDAIGPDPNSRRLNCLPGGSYRGLNFVIKNFEG